MFRGDIYPLIIGFLNAVYKVCEILIKAEKYIKNSGIILYEYKIKYNPGETISIKG